MLCSKELIKMKTISQVAELTGISIRALQYYDVISKSWKDEPGIFTIQVGASSRDIRLQKDFELKK